MAQDLFRVEVGFADDNVHYLSGAGAPSGGRADDAPIGSRWSNTTNGDAYTKTGATAWTKLAVGGDMSSLQTQVNDLSTEVDNIEAGVGLNTDGTYTAPVGSNYLGAATTVKAGLVALDGQLKTTTDNLGTLTTDFGNYQTSQDLRDDGQDIAIAGKVSKTGDTLSGSLAFGGTGTVTGLAAPVNPDDAATKNYVDNKVVGLSWQPPVGGIGATNPATCAIGDRFINTTDDKVYTATGVNDWGAGVAPDDGWATFDKSTETGYNFNGTDWVQFTGGGAIAAGIGLAMTGNQLDINLGAGIAQLPSDEVGIDVHVNGALMLTVDNASESTDTAAQLSVRLDGTTLTKGPGGLKLSAPWQLAITDNTAAIAQETIDRGISEGVLVGRLDNHDTDILLLQDTVNNFAHVKKNGTVAGGATGVIDHQLLDNVYVVNYLVYVRDTTNGRVTVMEILATHNGTETTAATQCDFTSFAKLKVGGTLAGLSVSVALVGSTLGAQHLDVVIGATNNIVTRIVGKFVETEYA